MEVATPAMAALTSRLEAGAPGTGASSSLAMLLPAAGLTPAACRAALRRPIGQIGRPANMATAAPLARAIAASAPVRARTASRSGHASNVGGG